MRRVALARSLLFGGSSNSRQTPNEGRQCEKRAEVPHMGLVELGLREMQFLFLVAFLGFSLGLFTFTSVFNASFQRFLLVVNVNFEFP